MKSSNLQEKAMIVRLHIGTWAGTLFDRAVTREIAENKHADPREAGRYIKNLVDREALKGINTVGNESRLEHYNLTMPWEDDGSRLLPTKVYEKYKAKIDKLIAERDQERKEFIENYERFVADAKQQLGDMFNPDDYPDKSKLYDKVYMEYRIRPVPDAAHFVANLSDREAEKIKADMERQIEAQLEVSISDLYARIAKAVKAASAKLSPREDGRVNIFRDSLIDNLRAVADVVPALNITDNPVLARASEDIKQVIDGVDPDELRERNERFDPAKLRSVKSVMDKMAVQFAGYAPE